ncbi:lytic transglycosylase domain-containing protein [Fimbriimonadia bacterium ATM]|nr:MAG: lytic transglycosylase domain-containing protein [Armatimonadota bacterium]MBC6968453.1 lytic transglycosylase domain-containing protein [Armatimonadota bacterium]MCE7898709.1 lytic transglycosylase domain-containing protein [Armatimonadetes bacterium ATM1]MDL1927999.1 lytic transglycosylase domain-containing protein [Fimbriimonadia bacterium ATM]RIJ98517.1 MAG: lytic transglycosylase [Armatimonadota bacterium]
MKIAPLGPDGIRARIAEIRNRLDAISQRRTHAQFDAGGKTFAESLGRSPVAGVGLGPLVPFDMIPSNGGVTNSALRSLADQAADEAGIDRDLFAALITAESAWNPNAVSPAGAKGLTQLMPGTALSLGVSDPFDPMQNLRGGAKYLRQQIERFGSVELALAAYNAGPGAVKKYGGIPPFPETQNYVKKILGGLSR